VLCQLATFRNEQSDSDNPKRSGQLCRRFRGLKARSTHTLILFKADRNVYPKLVTNSLLFKPAAKRPVAMCANRPIWWVIFAVPQPSFKLDNRPLPPSVTHEEWSTGTRSSQGIHRPPLVLITNIVVTSMLPCDQITENAGLSAVRGCRPNTATTGSIQINVPAKEPD